MIFCIDGFDDYGELRSDVCIPMTDGNTVKAKERGSVAFTAIDDRRVTLTDVLHVLELEKRLLSVPALTEKGAGVNFRRDKCVISYQDTKLFEIPRAAKMYSMEMERTNLLGANLVESENEDPVAQQDNTELVNETELWHARLSHVFIHRLPVIAKVADGIPATAHFFRRLTAGASEFSIFSSG